MTVRYTPEALAELDQVLMDIAEKSPQGARRVYDRIYDVITLVSEHPRSGQKTSLGALRRIVATPYPYLIYYQADGNDVIILGIRHAARDPSSMPDRT